MAFSSDSSGNPAPKTGTGFVGLQQYLDANQPAVDSTANTLAGNDEAAAGQAQFKDGLFASGVGAQHRSANPSNPDPSSLPDYASLQSNSQDAAANLGGAAVSGTKNTPTNQGLNSFGGLSSQLQSTFGATGPSPYTQGDNNLDANLLQGSTSAQGRFGAAQSKFAGLDDFLDSESKAEQSTGPSTYTNGGPARYTAPAAPTSHLPSGNIGQAKGGPEHVHGSAAAPTPGKPHTPPAFSVDGEGKRSGKGNGPLETGGGMMGDIPVDSGGGSAYDPTHDDRGRPGVTVNDPTYGDKTGFIPTSTPTVQSDGVTVTNGDGTQTGYIPENTPTVTYDSPPGEMSPLEKYWRSSLPYAIGATIFGNRGNRNN